MSIQCCNHVLMVRPMYFRTNSETLSTNAWQHCSNGNEKVAIQAISEFDNVVKLFSERDISVLTVDNNSPETPDAVFPNNWFSTYDNGSIFLHPMMVESRRKEKRRDILSLLQQNFEVDKIIDWSFYEQENRFLEGTGSVILDRVHSIAYACLSSRTDSAVFNEFCKVIGYKALSFEVSIEGQECYHTNIMMSIGEHFAVICSGIISETERQKIINRLSSHRQVIELSQEEMNSFCGNILEIKNKNGDSFVAISEQAYKTLNTEKKKQIEKYCDFIVCSIPTIEKYGGGGIRCMIAEIFLRNIGCVDI